jgi:hypothetical protein
MNGRQQGLRVRAFGFFLGPDLLSAVGTVAAQDRNPAYGTGALQNNTTGIDDSAFGFEALFSNTTGYYNTTTGIHTTGGANTAAGEFALVSQHHRCREHRHRRVRPRHQRHGR